MRKRRFTGMIAILIAVLLFTGCGSSMNEAYNTADSSSSYNGGSYDYDMAMEEGYSYGTAVTSSDSKSDMSDVNTIEPQEANAGTETNGSTDTQVSSDRKLIYRETRSVETLEFDSFLIFVETQTKLYGGYIESSSSSGNAYNYEGKANRYASYTLRIPTQHLQTMLNDIGNQANVIDKSGTTEDITLQYIDNQTHMESLQVEQDRLLELLEKAETLEDILQIESRLSDLRYQIEYYGSILRNYDNLVEYSTIYLNVSEVERIKDVEVETAWDRMTSGLKDTLYNIKEGSVDFGVGFVVNLPYLLIWAVIIFVVIFIIRKIVRHNRKVSEKRRAETLNYGQVNYNAPAQNMQQNMQNQNFGQNPQQNVQPQNPQAGDNQPK